MKTPLVATRFAFDVLSLIKVFTKGRRPLGKNDFSTIASSYSEIRGSFRPPSRSRINRGTTGGASICLKVFFGFVTEEVEDSLAKLSPYTLHVGDVAVF